MNCRPGDLAVIVRGANAGRYVTVIECRGEASWFVEPHYVRVVNHFGLPWLSLRPWAMDCDLRPIRDNDGDDESLSWAGKPEQVIA